MTEMLIYFMLVFSPWAFGTTEPWSIWIMNYAAFGLGALLITKWIIRFTTKYDIKLKNKILTNPQKKLAYEYPYNMQNILSRQYIYFTCIHSYKWR